MNKLSIFLCLQLVAWLSYSLSAQVSVNMLFVKGGSAYIGSEEGNADEKPVFQTYLRDFYLDKQAVTVAEFRRFARVNRFVTDAEKMGYAMVYDTSSHSWQKIKGAYWEYPNGKENEAASPQAAVTQISYYDAAAYANWLGKRLPNEFELEHVLKQNNQLNGFGTKLWYWTDSWYRQYSDSDYYRQKSDDYKTLRGGKSLKDASYRPSIRSKAEPRISYENVGFRCVKDIKE